MNRAEFLKNEIKPSSQWRRWLPGQRQYRRRINLRSWYPGVTPLATIDMGLGKEIKVRLNFRAGFTPATAAAVLDTVFGVAAMTPEIRYWLSAPADPLFEQYLREVARGQRPLVERMMGYGFTPKVVKWQVRQFRKRGAFNIWFLGA